MVSTTSLIYISKIFWISTSWTRILKLAKKEQAKRLRRETTGVAYGNPAHMLDASQYIKLALDAISDATIQNAFNKAELVTLKDGPHKEVDMMAYLLCSSKALNILIDENILDEFVHVNDKNSEEFTYEILVDVNEVLESIQATNDNKDEILHTVVESCAHSLAPTENDVTFCGLNTYSIKFLKLRISCCVPMCKRKQ